MKNFSIAKSRRLRSTPYTDRIEAHGVSSYTVYNHMLLPASFKSLESDYHHLKKYVQVWDVAAERQVEISGKDSSKLVQLMTCRDLSKSKVGKCYYAPLIDNDGLLVNDPIINKLAEDKWWLSIADADVIFFAKGLAAGNKFEVEINEPNVNILAVQGPMSDDLMSKLLQLMTCRDLSKSKVGRCYYAPLVDDQGLLVNDPIINKLADDRWWLSIADSDVIFFAKGLAAGNKFEVEIKEPNVNILAVQGPLSDDLMVKIFGEEIRQLKFFNFKYYEF